MELPFPSKELAPLYRFALLLTGDESVAEQVVINACAHCAPHLESYRTTASRTACLLVCVREQCLKHRPAPAAGMPAIDSKPHEPGAVLAQKISAMSEPERSALALFYLNTLPAREIAAILKLSLEDLAAALTKGRARLQKDFVSVPNEKPNEATDKTEKTTTEVAS